MTASVAEAVAQARAASDIDDDDRAMTLAAEALSRVDPAADSATAWSLAELLVELGDNDAAIALAARLTESSPRPEAMLRRAALLHTAGEDADAANVLRAAAAAHGTSLEIVGALLELALGGQGWSVLDGLPPAPQAATQMIEEAHCRTDGMVLADLDTRRLAYVLAGVVVLGASEDEGDAVAPYWFMTADEYEVAWWLRRLAGWLEAEAARPTTVVFADPAVEPIAIALAAHLGIPVSPPAGTPARALHLYSHLDSLDAAAPHPESLTVCLAVSEPPGWRALLSTSAVDIVGVFAPLELSWSAPDNGSPPPSAAVTASRILAELPNLPRDRALPAMLRFYRTHRVRARPRS